MTVSKRLSLSLIASVLSLAPLFAPAMPQSVDVSPAAPATIETVREPAAVKRAAKTKKTGLKRVSARIASAKRSSAKRSTAKPEAAPAKAETPAAARAGKEALVLETKTSDVPEPLPAPGMVMAVISTATKAEAKSKPFTARASSEYYMKHRRDHNAYAAMALDLAYAFDDKNSARILQSSTKYMVVPAGDAEFLLDDTTLQYTRVLIKDWNGFGVRLRPAFSLPTSRESGRQGIVSRPSLWVPVARKFAAGKLTATYTPFYLYQINKYQTRVGGDPLRQHSLGHSLVLAYAVTEAFSAAVTGQGQYNWDEQSPYAQVEARAKGSYMFDTGLSYSFGGNFELGVGYAQSDAFIREGRYDVNLYDPATARYYLSVSAAL